MHFKLLKMVLLPVALGRTDRRTDRITTANNALAQLLTS